MRKEEEEEDEAAAGSSWSRKQKRQFNERTTKRTCRILNFQKRQMTALVWLCALANANPSNVLCMVSGSGSMRRRCRLRWRMYCDTRQSYKSYIACEYAHMVCDLEPASCGERWKRDGDTHRYACHIWMNWQCEYWHWNWARNTHKHTGKSETARYQWAQVGMNASKPSIVHWKFWLALFVAKLVSVEQNELSCEEENCGENCKNDMFCWAKVKLTPDKLMSL